LRDLGGEPLLVHAVRRLTMAAGVGQLVVAAPPEGVDKVRRLLARQVPAGIALCVVAGGSTRQLSVRAALSAVPPGYDIVLVHDAARALAPPALVERVAAAVRDGHDAVIPVLPVVDTIKQVDDSGFVVGTVERAALRAVQTPQGFRRRVLESAHEQGRTNEHRPVDATDDAALVERLGIGVFCVPGDEAALKITRPADLMLAEALHLAGAGESG
jgi:2-C-methyl-D-erythritol 4-phosphate cytidylyltransferase